MRITTSSLVPSQLPEFIREDYPTFVAFMQAYYEYLDNQGVVLQDLVDLDNTLDDFIVHFKKELAINVPTDLQVDYRFLLKNVKDLYLAKGSEASYKLLFKLLYNKNVSVQYPGQKMLRASDGRWQQDTSVFIKIAKGTPDLIVGHLVDVVKPDTVIKVLINRTENVEIEIDRVVQLSDNIYEFFIERNFFGDIAVGDVIRYKTEFAGTVVATTGSLKVKQSGSGFTPGMLFELKNGSGVRSVLKITRVDGNGGILSAEFIKFGVGYATDFTISLDPLNNFLYASNASSQNTISIVPGGVNIFDYTDGNSEQGYVNLVDYSTSTYWDGTYAGTTLREFSATPTAVFTANEALGIVEVSLGSIAKYPGYYTSNAGFLDDDIYIQDSKYYQSFSYVLRIDERLSTYRDAVRTIVHPAGVALFGEYEISNNFDISLSLQSLVRFLALSFTDEFTTSSDSIKFAIEKYLTESISGDDGTYHFDISKVLADSLDTPTDLPTFATSKVLSDSFDTPTDSAAILTGKSLTDSLSTPDDSVYTFNTGKALSDSLLTPTDTTALVTAKYLTDSTTSEDDSGYVAKNPYSQGGYFAITPIIYDNTIETTF